ncbi:MAG: sigma 54-interacting transcriptional regulator [Sodalis sp. (in: enterobacteria)]
MIPRSARLVELYCADYANNPELLSSTLFGYVKGAFTGADKKRKPVC